LQQGRRRCPAALACGYWCLVLSWAPQRRFRPSLRLLSDLRDPRCAPSRARCAAPTARDLAAGLGADSEAKEEVFRTEYIECTNE
jgi:hypothetical protein